MLVEDLVDNFRLKICLLNSRKGKKGSWTSSCHFKDACVLNAFSIFSKNFSKTRRIGFEYLLGWKQALCSLIFFILS